MRETFREETNLFSGDDGERALRAMQWSWDPDPNDDTTLVEYVIALRENGSVTTLHDHHVEGLFSQGTWRRLLESAGYRVETTERPRDDGSSDEIFLCRRSKG